MTKDKNIVLKTCSCGCCMLMIEKHEDETGICYNISIVDSRYDHNAKGILNRIKNAIKILFGKPVYYNDLLIEDETEFKQLIQELETLL